MTVEWIPYFYVLIREKRGGMNESHFRGGIRIRGNDKSLSSMKIRIRWEGKGEKDDGDGGIVRRTRICGISEGREGGKLLIEQIETKLFLDSFSHGREQK